MEQDTSQASRHHASGGCGTSPGLWSHPDEGYETDSTSDTASDAGSEESYHMEEDVYRNRHGEITINGEPVDGYYRTCDRYPVEDEYDTYDPEYEGHGADAEYSNSSGGDCNRADIVPRQETNCPTPDTTHARLSNTSSRSHGWWSDLTSSAKLLIAGAILQQTVLPAVSEIASSTRDALVVCLSRKICDYLGAAYVPSEEGAGRLLASLGHDWVKEALAAGPVNPEMVKLRSGQAAAATATATAKGSIRWRDSLKGLIPGLLRRRSGTA